MSNILSTAEKYVCPIHMCQEKKKQEAREIKFVSPKISKMALHIICRSYVKVSRTKSNVLTENM